MLELQAHQSGLINADSSANVPAYQISRYWRELFQRATNHPSDLCPRWTEREVAAANIINASLLYLAMLECDNVETLLVDVARMFAADSSTRRGSGPPTAPRMSTRCVQG